MTSADLWLDNHDVARSCLEHPFVQGIGSGALDRRAFEFYVAQDAVFLEAFARGYALALAKTPDRSSMREFHDLLSGVLDELELHSGYAKRWGVDLDPEPAPATRCYTDFLLRVASLEPVGHLLAAMTPCMRLYSWLGRELSPTAHVESPYHEWVETYSSDEFDALAVTLEALLDRHGGDADIVASHYGTAMRLEHAFFTAAHAAGREP